MKTLTKTVLAFTLTMLLAGCAEHTKHATLYCPDGRTVKHINIKECK